MPKLAYTTFLKTDPELQRQYRAYHDRVWPEVIAAFRTIGVNDLNIWQLDNRLFMTADVDENFDFDAGLSAYLEVDPKCREWESMMDEFQEAPPGAPPGDKWVPLEHLYSF